MVNDNHQLMQVEFPSKRATVVASLICFFVLIGSYWLESPLVAMVEERWARFLVYAILPVAITFIVLYRGGWHSEITGLARTCVLVVVSWVILAGVVLVVGIMVCLEWFCLNAVSGGFHP